MDSRTLINDASINDTSAHVSKLPLRILLVRFGAMGDIIHALPAAAALRLAYPHARLDWLVETRWRALLESGRDGTSRPAVDGEGAVSTRAPQPESNDRSLPVAAPLDHVISLDTFALRRNFSSMDSWSTLCALVKQLRNARYDMAVDLQGAIKSALACKLSGAARVFGFARNGDFAQPWLREQAASFFYTRDVESGARHIVDANLDLAEAVIASSHRTQAVQPGRPESNAFDAPPRRVVFPLPLGDTDLLPPEISTSGFAVMNPGAGWRSKQWSAASFAAVCDALISQRDIPTVLNCGPGERELSEQVQAACATARPIIFRGEIPALIALLRRARLMIGPDTGPLHLAAALGVPTVGLYGPTDPARNGPYGMSVHCLRVAEARTSYKHGEPPDGSMDAITPAMVLAAIQELDDASCTVQPRP